MSKLRQIIKLYCQHNGTRSIGDATGVSRNTVKKYIAHFRFLKTTWEELSSLSDKDLQDLFEEAPAVELSERMQKMLAYFPYAEKRLKQRGMTLLLLWKEYEEKHPEGYRSSGFYHHFKLWKRRSHPSMHMVHKAGDKMFVDYTGEKLHITDVLTGQVTPVEVFVAILGASQFTYVEAVESQDMEDFIMCCENALHFFGGAPSAIVPDNLKSAVTKSSRYEPQLNENFEAFADHYGMCALPARTYKPKDKSLVEGAVKITYTRLYTNLDGRKFNCLQKLNEAIWELLEEKHNGLNFQGRSYSRKQQFVEMEKVALQSLPATRFEMRKSVVITVMKNGHICLHSDKHYYSVPYSYIGKKVKVLYSKSRVEVYYKYAVIATHQRVKSPHNYTTDPAHMATHHQYLTDWNPDRFLSEARLIHKEVELFIEQVLLRKTHPEQAYKSCQGILSFAKRVGHHRLIKACRRAHGYGQYHYKIIETILQRNLDQSEMEDDPITMPTHDNIRGENYYQ